MMYNSFNDIGGDCMTLGSKIKKRREELGLTLAQVADKIGVSEATVQRYESDVIKNPTQPRIVALAKVLNVDANYLMGWEDSKPVHKDLKPVTRRKIPMLGEVAAGVEIVQLCRKGIGIVLCNYLIGGLVCKDIAVDRIAEFEARLNEHMDNRYSDVLSAIRPSGKLEPATEEQLKAEYALKA